MIEGKWVQEDLKVVLINVYAPNDMSEKKNSMGVLTDLRSQFIIP